MLMYTVQLLCTYTRLCVIDTAACQKQRRQLLSICGRRNGITLLTSLLKCLPACSLKDNVRVEMFSFYHMSV